MAKDFSKDYDLNLGAKLGLESKKRFFLYQYVTYAAIVNIALYINPTVGTCNCSDRMKS